MLLAFLLLCAGLCTCFTSQAKAAPQQFVMAPPATRVDGDTLRVDLSLTVDDEDGLRDLLKDGAVLALTVSLEMDRSRSWWTNAAVVSKSYTSNIRHDPLTRDFVLTLPTEGGEKQLRDKNLTRLLHNSWRKLSFPLTSLQVLQEQGQDEEYNIILKVQLQHTEVPPWLEKSIVFWSADIVPEQTRTLIYQTPPHKK